MCLFFHRRRYFQEAAASTCTNRRSNSRPKSNTAADLVDRFVGLQQKMGAEDLNLLTPLLPPYLLFWVLIPSQLSQINSVSETTSFPTNQLVLVPVNCSCSGLSTCQAIQSQKRTRTVDIFPGETLTVPLRCACPTKNQSDLGIRYLLSYLITWGDEVSTVSVRFGADVGRALEANEISEQATIYPFTTLLIPLQNPPTSSQTVVPPPPPPSPPASPSPSPPSPNSDQSSNKTWSKKQPGPIIVSQSFEAHEKPHNKNLDEEPQDLLESAYSIAQSLKVYSYEDLIAATDNFSPSCWIKGSVFRGRINGDLAAIKKMNGDVSKEVDLLNKINHSNLIRLSGVCFNDGQWCLVYDEENRNLSDVLNGVLSEEGRLEESLSQLIDPSMQGNYPSGLAVLILRLIVTCLNKNPSDRPAMDEIVQSLTVILTASLAWELSNNTS
ncbi:hypothetical protein OIU78_028852 [Salix suchowensis]|nr:hypothetical protein OIU78_028852 [Salix suchowensis]